jgi:hypothetical protein
MVCGTFGMTSDGLYTHASGTSHGQTHDIKLTQAMTPHRTLITLYSTPHHLPIIATLLREQEGAREFRRLLATDTVRPRLAVAHIPGQRGYLSQMGGTSSRLPNLLITLTIQPVSRPRDRHLLEHGRCSNTARGTGLLFLQKVSSSTSNAITRTDLYQFRFP